MTSARVYGKSRPIKSYIDLGTFIDLGSSKKPGVVKVIAVEKVVMNGSPGDAARHAMMLKVSLKGALDTHACDERN